MLHSTITKRGQTTIPRQIRDALHLQGGEQLTYELLSDGVLVKAHPGVMASFGALKLPADKRNVDIKKARKQAIEEHAAETAEEGR